MATKYQEINLFKGLLLYYILPLYALFMHTTSAFAVPEHDLSSERVLYAVGTAHLDTQWRWTIQTTIDDYIKKTLDDNFSLFEQYPNYTFSFEGAFRYMLMKEYYPDRYATMADYIDQGRWQVAGSTLENGDMNIVSPESLIRQALIGNNFFEDEFNKRSTDIFLPDCFGFSYTLPTWASHCGLNGFSTQKLTWGSAVGIPFNIGLWQGPDDSSIIAALNAGAYVSDITSDLSNNSKWLDRINETGNKYGIYADYKYFGTGDTGGAPSAGSCYWLEQGIAGSGPITVVSAGSDDLYNDITPAQKASLPVYDGELLMRIHGTGCYTSQSAMKRWNRQNELLGDSAERVAFIADWLGYGDYPQDVLDNSWIRFLWHSHHDDLTGTSIPKAYHFSWNDEILSLNQFSSVLNNAVSGICQALDTQTTGVPVVVYNPLGFSRQDIVEATVTYNTTAPDFVKVFDGSQEVASQVVSQYNNSVTVVFSADVPSVGFKVYDVRSSAQQSSLTTDLSITDNSLENSFYRVTLNGNGDISSVWDKQNARELLSAPCRLELLSNYSPSWPAWEIRYEDIQQPPYDYVDGPAEITIVEDGAARAALQIKRTHGQQEISTFIQEISLASGDNQIVIENLIDWRTTGTLLKASFPLSAHNSQATYDLGMGTIQRPNNQYSTYEVPAQQWADITNTDNSFGVSILNDCRYGWDKPTDNILRLTMLHTPSVAASYTDQSTQDLGQHKLTYAIAPHTGNWIDGEIPQRAARLNQPLIAFQSDKHPGYLGSTYSFLTINNPQVFVKAVKKAQRSDELIVRFQELYGQAASDVLVSVGEGIQSAREVNGCEQDITAAAVAGGQLEFSMMKYQPKTFALTLNPPVDTVSPPNASLLEIPYNLDAFSWDSNRSDGDFDNGMTYPAELMPDTLVVNDIPFQMGSRTDGQNNALACTGQAVYLGSHSYDTLYLLAASRGGDVKGTFTAGSELINLSIQDYHENVVDWGRENDAPYLKRDKVAWIGTHRHNSDGNMAYEFCNLYFYRIDLPTGATSVILPDQDDIVVFAMTLANHPENNVRPAGELYDTLPYIPELAPKPETRKNLALNKPVTADGYISGENPELAVDGQTANNSKWAAISENIEPHWLVMDLQQYYDVDTFVIRHAGDGGETSSWNTSDFCIQTSPNGVANWSDLVCIEGNTHNVSRHVISPTPVRYVRLYITRPAQNNNTAVRIYEFEIYGPCDGFGLQGDISGPEGVPDCYIDIHDLQKIAKDWLLCNEPMDITCQDYWLSLYPDMGSTEQPPADEPASLPDESLVAYWKVEEGSGQTIHDLAGADDAGLLLGTNRPQWTTGWFPQHNPNNNALYFNTTGYVMVNPVSTAASPNLHDLLDAITISAWFNADDWNGNRRILQKGNSDNQYRLLAEGGRMIFEIYNIGGISTELPSTGIWHHIAGVYDGTSMKIYIDGIEQATMYASGPINLTDDPIYIGTKNSQAPSGDYFKGYLDDIRIYSVGLTGHQIRELARQGQNTLPVILDIDRRDDMLVSVTGSSTVDAVVYDVNGDSLQYQWTETNSSPFVSFKPDASAEDPEISFSEAGDYTLQLEVSDGSGQSTTQQIEFHLVNPDCITVREMNYVFNGDVNFDCHVDLKDLSIISRNWLSNAGNQAVSTNTFQEWGNESMAQISTDYLLSNGLYAQSLTERWTAYAWPQGIMFGAVVAAAKVDSSYLPEAETIANLIQSNYWCTSGELSGYNASAGNCGDRYTDDTAWIILALLELHDITNNNTYLTRAQKAMEFVNAHENGPGVVPQGGIRWHETNTCGTRTCSTAPACLANLILYQKTGNAAYLQNGLRIYTWAVDYGLQNSITGLFYEGIDCSGVIDYISLGYDTAPMLQAVVRLYQITGNSAYLTEAQHLAYAMETHFVNSQNHALNQTGKWCGHDMTNALVDLYEVDGNQRWLNVAAGYLQYLHDHCKADGYYPATWNDISGNTSSELLDLASAARAYWTLARTEGGTTTDYPVLLFADCQYGGWSLGLDQGEYTSEDLRFHGIKDNSISSLKVAPGYVLTLYSNDNFTGASLVKTGNRSCLVDDNWNDAASSLKIKLSTP